MHLASTGLRDHLLATGPLHREVMADTAAPPSSSPRTPVCLMRASAAPSPVGG